MAPSALPSHSAKKGKISLRVEPSRAAPGGAVAVGVPVKLNAHLLRALECGGVGGTHGVPDASLADLTIVAYAAVLKVRAKLAADPKAGAACCAAFASEFVISAACDKTMSSARKTAAAILSSLRFGSLAGSYSSLARSLGVVPEKKAYLHAAAALRAALLKGVTVVIAGRINVSRAEIAAKAADTLAGKLAAATDKAIPSGKARSGAAFGTGGDAPEACPSADLVTLPAGGLKAALLSRFLATRGIAARVDGSGAVVEARDERAALNSKSAAAAYVKKWRVGGRALLAYQAAVNCEAPTSALKVSGDAPAASWITGAL